MTGLDKLLDRMRTHPRTVRFADLVRVLQAHSVVVRPGKGSHCVAIRGETVYTIKKPAPGHYVHPKSVKHCLQAFGLWD